MMSKRIVLLICTSIFLLSIILSASADETAPVTVHDYDDLWHTTDFTVTLSATDDVGEVTETNYKINEGPTENVSTDGHPFITTESSNNTLEYWSVDNASNVEPPNYLTGIKLDKTAPTGSMIIDGGDAYTTTASVVLTLTAVDDTAGVDQARFSNDDVWDSEPWEAFSSPKAWTLTSGDGDKTVYFQVRDNAGLVSDTYSDTISLDTTPPTGSITVNDNATYTTTTAVTLTLSANETVGTIKMRFSNDDVTYTDWENYTTSKSWILQDGDGAKTVFAQFKGHAGLISTFSDTISLDTTSPTGSITIAGNVTYTPSTSVTLTLFAEDIISGIAQMHFSNDEISWSDWELYTTSKSWTLSNDDGTKTVYVQFLDNAGLISRYQDTIILDTTYPEANAGPDQTVDEDTELTFDGSASIDNIGITSYTWAFFDETPQTLTGTNPTYTFNTPGSYTVTLSVTDAVLHSATDTVVITVIDITQPIANAGDDQVVHEDTLVTFDGSGSTDNLEIASYVWAFIDATAQNLHGINSTYIFDMPSVYNVTLTISDAQGNSATDIVIITVIDATWPAANAGHDQIVEEDTLVDFNGSASSDNVGIITYVWTFTDGTLQTMFGVNPSYPFETPGVYTVTLNVTDAEGHFTTDTVVITVQDITPPLIDIGHYATIVENVPVNLDASGSLDNVAIVDYLWDFGDGTSENSTIPSVIHTYTQPGVYMITLTIADEAGNIDSTSTSIVVYRDTDGDLIADYIDTDDDNDEMSDDWEIFNGLNPLDPSDASLDPDGDSLSNLSEYQLNSDPNDYTSPSPIPLVGVLIIGIIGFIIFLGILFMRKL